MPIPTTRSELTELVSASFAKLQTELKRAGPEVAELWCVDDWTVKDLLAVRAWWTERVVHWIEAGWRALRERDRESLEEARGAGGCCLAGGISGVCCAVPARCSTGFGRRWALRPHR